MSAVLASIDRPFAAAWRPGPLDAVVAFERFERDAAPLPGGRVETLIVERCAAAIAAEAGACAQVEEIGAASRCGALLRDAITALRRRADAAGTRIARRLVYVSAATADALSTDNLGALLGRVGTRHGDDTLLVVACGLDLPRIEALAYAAGWQHCQYWADGQGRAAVHVLERGDAARLRAR